MMNGNEPPGGFTPPVDDTGPPIPELADLIEPAVPFFERRVQNRIQRRIFGANIVGYAFLTPVLVMLEFLQMVCDMLGGVNESNGRAKR